MRLGFIQSVALMAVTVIGMPAADNTIGSWKRNVDKSKYSPMPANPYKSQTTVREAAPGGGVKVTSKGQRMDRSPAETTYTVKYDGKFVPVTGSGNLFDSISTTQVDANNLIVETKKNGGKYQTKGKIVVSSDGKTMTNTSSGTDAEGKPLSFTIVHDKL